MSSAYGSYKLDEEKATSSNLDNYPNANILVYELSNYVGSLCIFTLPNCHEITGNANKSGTFWISAADKYYTTDGGLYVRQRGEPGRYLLMCNTSTTDCASVES